MRVFIAISLLIVWSGAQSNERPQTSQIKTEQKSEVAEKNKSTTKQLNPALEFKSVPDINVNNRKTNEYKGEDEGTEFWPKVFGFKLKITDSLLVVFTFVLAIFTGLLWCSTDKLWKDTKASIATAEKAANAAMKSAEVAEYGLRLAERANLRVDQWTVAGIVAGERPNLAFKFTNSGRSQAEIIEVLGGCGIGNEDKVPDVPPYHNQPVGPGIAYPQASIDMSIGLNDLLTLEEFEKIKTGQSFIFLYGKITCVDIFGWTCEVAYGAQYGNLGEGEFGVTFMKRPGYNYVCWHRPTSKNKRQV